MALLSTDTSAAPAENEYQHQFCGGSMLDATHVVTAAHCVYDSLVPGQAAPPASLEVLVGTDVLADPDNEDSHGDADPIAPGPDEQRRAVLATSFDPDYDPNLTDHDAALLTLAQPITTPAAAPIDILDATTESSFADPGDAVTVSGWGSTVKQDPDFSREPSYPHALNAVYDADRRPGGMRQRLRRRDHGPDDLRGGDEQGLVPGRLRRPARRRGRPDRAR